MAFITIRNPEGKIRYILEEKEIVKIEPLSGMLDDCKVEITFKKSIPPCIIHFANQEERDFFLGEIHESIESRDIKCAPAKELKNN